MEQLKREERSWRDLEILHTRADYLNVETIQVLLDSLSQFPDDFMAEREQPEQQVRLMSVGCSVHHD